MSALSDKGITLEGLAAAVDALRQELATWKALAHKQDQLTADQITATQSGATAAKISQIAVNTAAIQSLAAQVAGQISLAYVTTLPATGEPLTLYLVPQGDGAAPNFCNEYLWINDAWELIGTTGAMANNGELSIQVNGVTVGTFTANQATNSAVNITVPTNTNQLINGAGYVDTAALQAALALKQNSLNATQLEAVNSGITAALVTQIGTNATAISGKQDALTAAQQAAVDSGATAAKIDQIASNASAIVSLTSSKQDTLSTTQLAAVNSGVTSAAVAQIGANADNISALGTAVAGKAADSAVVHKAGAETITGDKTFTGSVVTHHVTPETDNTYSLGSSSYQWSSVYAQTYYYNGTAWGLDKANVWTNDNTIAKDTSPALYLKATNLTRGTPPSVNITADFGVRASNGVLISQLATQITTNGNTYVYSRAYDGTRDQRVGIFLDVANNTVSYRTASNGVVNLGDSSYKWKTLNGINPGALSLPDISKKVNLDTTTWDLSGGNNAYTPSADGFLSIRSTAATQITIVENTTGYGTSVVSPTSAALIAFLPVTQGMSINIIVNCTSLNQAVFLPAKGNV